jgi:hypothetical protein
MERRLLPGGVLPIGGQAIKPPLAPGDCIRQCRVAGQMPVQHIAALQQQQPGQRQPIAIAQRLLPVSLAGPLVLRWDHAHQAGPIAQHQQIGGLQEHPQVGAATIHITDHRLQGGRQLPPVAGGQHPREGAQRIAKEA